MKFSLRRYVVLVTMAGLVLASTAALAPTSSADPLADKRVEAERISQQLSALDTKMELLGEDYNQAQVALDDVQVDSDAAAVRVDAADAALAVLRARLADMAVEAYMRGGQSDLPEILLKGSGPTVSRQIEYLQAASANQRQLIDDVAVAQQQADIEPVSQPAVDLLGVGAGKRLPGGAKGSLVTFGNSHTGGAVIEQGRQVCVDDYGRGHGLFSFALQAASLMCSHGLIVPVSVLHCKRDEGIIPDFFSKN